MRNNAHQHAWHWAVLPSFRSFNYPLNLSGLGAGVAQGTHQHHSRPTAFQQRTGSVPFAAGCLISATHATQLQPKCYPILIKDRTCNRTQVGAMLAGAVHLTLLTAHQPRGMAYSCCFAAFTDTSISVAADPMAFAYQLNATISVPYEWLWPHFV